jgi:hypothetical protein
LRHFYILFSRHFYILFSRHFPDVTDRHDCHEEGDELAGEHEAQAGHVRGYGKSWQSQLR